MGSTRDASVDRVNDDEDDDDKVGGSDGASDGAPRRSDAEVAAATVATHASRVHDLRLEIVAVLVPGALRPSAAAATISTAAAAAASVTSAHLPSTLFLSPALAAVVVGVVFTLLHFSPSLTSFAPLPPALPQRSATTTARKRRLRWRVRGWSADRQPIVPPWVPTACIVRGPRHTPLSPARTPDGKST